MNPTTNFEAAAGLGEDPAVVCAAGSAVASPSTGAPPAGEVEAQNILRDPGDDVAATSFTRAQRLLHCEVRIDRGLYGWIDVTEALCEVRDDRLYLESGFATWEDYCQKHWQFSARRARQLCQAAEALRDLRLPGDPVEFAMPASERHVRVLYRLPAEHRRAAWIEAVTTAPGGVVTAKYLAAVVQKRRQLLGLAAIGDRPPAAAEQSTQRGLTPGPQSKDELIEAQADKTIKELVQLLDLLGTADSVKVANVRLALNDVQDLRDQMARNAEVRA